MVESIKLCALVKTRVASEGFADRRASSDYDAATLIRESGKLQLLVSLLESVRVTTSHCCLSI